MGIKLWKNLLSNKKISISKDWKYSDDNMYVKLKNGTIEILDLKTKRYKIGKAGIFILDGFSTVYGGALSDRYDFGYDYKSIIFYMPVRFVVYNEEAFRFPTIGDNLVIYDSGKKVYESPISNCYLAENMSTIFTALPFQHYLSVGRPRIYYYDSSKRGKLSYENNGKFYDFHTINIQRKKDYSRFIPCRKIADLVLGKDD